MSHAIGDRLEHFEILAHLGAGGMGEVYKARDARINRLVAIKVLNEKFSDRFDREAQAISALNHPHICTLYDVGSSYLVMELLEGETLAARLRKGRLPMELVLRYGAEIADALAAAHANGIIHRDLKPGNLMVAKSGIKVLDFGLAKNTQSDETVTVSHLVQGTPAYMAPEQLEGKPCDARTDIYALGLVLYEMATGRRLRQGETPNLDDMPERFAHVLDKCVKSEPENRWQSARDVKSELEWAGKSAVPDSPSKPLPRWAMAAAALACAGIVIAVVLWFRSSDRPSGNPAPVEFSVFPAKGTTFPLLGGGGPWPAVSPDGRHLAFVALRADGEQQIWVRPLHSSAARPLQGTHGAMRPFWSSDSRSIGYFANSQLLRVDLDSAEPRVVCDAPYLGGLAGTWAGDVILFSRQGGIYRVRASGGPATIALADYEEIKPHAPNFLPDGRHFLYLEYSPAPERNQVCVASLDSRETSCFSTVRSAARYVSPSYLFFIQNQALVAQSFDSRSLTVSRQRVAISGVQVSIGPPIFHGRSRSPITEY